MTARTVYHVVPDGSDWAVKKEGAGRASKRFSNKAPAIAWARETAKNNRPSQVFVHGKDGKIQDEWTYNGDPYPPSG